jgi:K+-transporting ATPase ATPase A chain
MNHLAALLVILVAAALSWPAGRLMTWALEPSAPGPFRRRLDGLLRRIGGRSTDWNHDWRGYSLALLAFAALSFAACFAILLAQGGLPLNPDGRGAVGPSLAFHTAASFATNTNLQHYSGEAAMSHFSQLFALMWLQFVSAATGLAVLAALCRALAGRAAMGSFPLDLLRATFLVLLPLALVMAILLLAGGVPMTLGGAVEATGLEGAAQVIARGPVAAFVAIKQLGTNGGGFFGANSAHPFENPSAFTNLASAVAILVIPMACVWYFGAVTGRRRHAAVVFAIMAALLLAKTGLAIQAESRPAAALASLPVAAGPNLEGKELRFGAAAGAAWSVLTTSTSNGSVNCMHDSLNPLTGLVPLAAMWLNVAFGGVGVGFVNMFVYIVIAVFICGMMVGRTPEYLGRKVETREMKLALLTLLLHPLLILGGTALFAMTPWGAATVANPGAHGFTEILYEFTSAAANNGSGFEGLADNTTAWNVATGLVMLLARFLPIVLPLAIAGSLATKRPSPEGVGTLRTDTALFGAVILGCVLLVGALLFVPASVLGPIAEHLGAR